MWKKIWPWIRDIIIPAAVLYVLAFHVFALSIVAGNSMEPTLSDGAVVIMHRYNTGNVSNGDIIMCSSPTYKNGIKLIKRVIAIGGDRLQIRSDGTVVLNGAILEEPYIMLSEVNESGESTIIDTTIPDGYVFIMGDNRGHSMDSRSPEIGLIPLSQIIAIKY